MQDLDDDLDGLVRTMNFEDETSQANSESVGYARSESLSARSTVRRGNLMPPASRRTQGSEGSGSMTSNIRSQSSELGVSKGDTLTFVTSKSQTADAYQGLDDFSDIFNAPPVDMLRYPKIEGQKTELPTEGKYDLQGFSSVDLIKKHKLYLFVNESSEFAKICGKPIGQGVTFCTIKNCVVPKHKKMTTRLVTMGNLYVARTLKSAFTHPTISTEDIQDEVVET